MNPERLAARTPRPAPLVGAAVEARVVDCHLDGALYWDLRVEAAGLPAGEPGQFSLLAPAARGAWDPLLPRPLSLLDAGAGWQRFLFKRVGRGTALLAALRVGDPLSLIGPLGHPFGALRSDGAGGAGSDGVLVGGGVGIPPLHFLARRLAAAGRPVRMLFGFNRAAEIPAALLAEFAGELQLCTLDGSAGERGNPVALLAATRGEGPLAIKGCGPAPMLAALREAARPGDHLELSLEEHMACGVGVCRGCMVPVADGAGGWRYATVCREGPVFDAALLVAPAPVLPAPAEPMPAKGEVGNG
jgi:dihydroorotate dehydrogenase electron transfer subunit